MIMAIIFKHSKLNVESVVWALLKKLDVKVSYTTVATCLQDHPEYPSLLAISDCLTEWGVTNLSYNVDIADFDESDLYFPFIAHFSEKGGWYVLVSKIEDHKVYYSEKSGSEVAIPVVDFLKRWQGIALHGTAKAVNGEVNYKTARIKEILQQLIAPFAILLGVGLLYASIASQPVQLSVLVLIFLKLSGISLSVLLLMQSLNANNPFIKNLCSLGGKSDCNAILKSDAAKLTPWLSWSEVGFFYFSGTFLSLLFVPASVSILACLSVLALPYTIYSISYQYSTKNWCVLCCGVQAIIALEAVTFFSAQSFRLSGFNFSFTTIALSAAGFLIPILIWAFLKPFFTTAAQLTPIKKQLKKFKYNSDLFNQALKNQPRYAVNDELMPIKLGNAAAEIVITMVSNPFCGPCAKAHQTIDEWLRYRDDIQLKLVFTSTNADDDPKTKVSRHLSALSKLENKELVSQSLNNWYNSKNKNYETWAVNYPVELNDDLAKVTEKQKAWCELAEIKFTPTILINGFRLPEPYRLEDIKYLLT